MKLIVLFILILNINLFASSEYNKKRDKLIYALQNSVITLSDIPVEKIVKYDLASNIYSFNIFKIKNYRSVQKDLESYIFSQGYKKYPKSSISLVKEAKGKLGSSFTLQKKILKDESSTELLVLHKKLKNLNIHKMDFNWTEERLSKKRLEKRNGVVTDTYFDFSIYEGYGREYTHDIEKTCRNLDVNGKSNWRVPHEEEVKYVLSIENFIDSSNKNFMVNNTYLGDSSGKFYFSHDTQIVKHFSIGGWPSFYYFCVSGSEIKDFYAMSKKASKINNTKLEKYFTKRDKYLQIANSEKSINAYLDFIKNYPHDENVNLFLEQSYAIAKKKDDLPYLLAYFDKAKDALGSQPTIIIDDYYKTIYSHVNRKNNIAGYEWFVKEFYRAPQVKKAISQIHKLAYADAKDIDTLSAYNTFICAYPYAKEVEKANKKAYAIENDMYDVGMMSSFLNGEEKQARKLLIRAKKLERSLRDYDRKTRVGYIIVLNRMYSLLEEKFDTTEATVRHLESQEFKEFVETFRASMSSINYALQDISKHSKDMLEITKRGFADARADEAMARNKAKEHFEWDKWMHYKDKGYMN